MSSELKELIKLAEDIAILESGDNYAIPMIKVNQRDVLRKRIERKLQRIDYLELLAKEKSLCPNCQEYSWSWWYEDDE